MTPSEDAQPGRGWPRPSWRALLLVGLVSRVAVLLIGIALAREEMPEWFADLDREVAAENLGYNARHRAALLKDWRRAIEPWYRWDAIWYAELSRTGYTYARNYKSTSAFMPLLPMIMAAGAAVGLDRYAVGLAAVNGAFVLGLAVFGRMARRASGDDRTAWKACLLLIAYPQSLFFAAPYNESLGFALQGAAILAWLNRRPALAGLSLAWASLARLTVLALPVGLVVQWAADLVRRRPARHAAWLVTAAGAVGLGAFLLFMTLRFGDPLLHFKGHAAWGREPISPRNVLLLLGQTAGTALVLAATAILLWMVREAIGSARVWRNAPAPESAPATVAGARPPWALTAGVLGLGVLIALAWSGLIRIPTLPEMNKDDHLVTITFLGLGVHAWLKRGPFWGCLVLVPMLQALATGSALSMARIVLGAFPAFIDAAEMLTSRFSFWACTIALLVLQVRAIDRFVNFAFVG